MTLPVIADHECQASAAAATEGKALFVIIGSGRNHGNLERGMSVTAKGFRAIMELAAATTLALDMYPGGEPLTYHVCKMDISQCQGIVFEAPIRNKSKLKQAQLQGPYGCFGASKIMHRH